MALSAPPYFLHFLQPGEAMPTRGSTDDWGGCRLWKDKQQGLRFDPKLGPDQLRFIREYAEGERVAIEEARRVFIKLQAEADCNVERLFELVRRAASDNRGAPLPCRWNCMYVFDASLDITAYAATMGIPLDRTLVRSLPW
jgi:hypothetical protein